MDDRMAYALRESFPINVEFLAPYPDFLAFLFVLLVAAFLSVGVKESSWLNIVFTTVNMATILIMIVAGAIRCKSALIYVHWIKNTILFNVLADPANWRIEKDQIPEGVNGGEGGFMPFGIAGVMAGAAKCFYGFVGFDCIATTGEEAKNPQRNIPIAIVLSLLIIFLAYLGVSTVLTMMWPYYLMVNK